MSSVASKHALLIALGGVSIAALFVWYVHAKREEEKRKQRDTVLKAAEPKKETKQKSVEKPQKPAEPKVEAKVEEELAPEDKLVEELNQELANAPRVVEKPREPSISLPEQIEETDVKVKVISHEEAEILRNIRDDEEPSNELEESSNDAVPRASEFPPLPITEESLEAKEEAEKIGEECERALAGGDFPPSTYSEVVQTSPEEVAEKKAEEARREEAEKIEIAEKEFPPLPDLEEENLKEKEVENQKSSTSSADLTTDSAQEPEITAEEILELTHLDEPLSLDVMQQSPAAFSWSEEMERTYSQEQSFNMTIESSDADPFVDSPRSPHFEKQRSQHRKNRNRRNRNSTSKSDRGSVQPATQNIAQKGSKQEKKQQSKHVETQKKVEPTPLPEELHQVHENLGYEKSESPGVASQHSEVSSQDSGRATGGLASSLSPMDEHMVNGNVQDGTLVDDLMDPMPMYEFEIPNSLVGLVIGIKGKTIRELSVRTKVRMLIRQHHTPEKVDTHQICQVRGQREEINHCLQMLRRRFPPARFPELNLQPVLPPPLPNHYFDMIHTQPSWLTLPEEVPCEVAVSNMVDVSQFFLQQPTHPSFASLRHLDLYMLRLYSEHTQIPELPVPCQTGLLCAAPVMNAWFRAVTVNYFEESDEVLIRFVDYGGYARLPRQELRQIRTDLMSLPFQATEVCLAHVKPVDGTLQWDEKAFEEFRSLCMGKVVTAKCIGYAADTKVPMVELYVSNDETDERKVVRFDTHLMELGLARTSDPSKMIRTSLSSMIHKRLSVSSQNSINA